MKNMLIVENVLRKLLCDKEAEVKQREAEVEMIDASIQELKLDSIAVTHYALAVHRYGLTKGAEVMAKNILVLIDELKKKECDRWQY